MYSEHLIAELLPLVQGWYPTGTALDQELTRVSVEIGRLFGHRLGCEPSDTSLAWWAAATGTETAPGTRGAIHVLPDGRTALGLGPTRGVIETAGDRFTLVRHPEDGRYTTARLLPTIQYGGLR